MGNAVAVTEQNFDSEVIQSKVPVLVDFWAQWCGPCRMLAPIVESLAKQYAGNAQVVKLNVDDNPSAVQRYRIQAIPTLVLFQNGEEKDRMIGVTTKEAIARTIDAHLGAASN